MAAAITILPRYVRRRRASFVLTSLIDVIFLLVIFFMVSSQIVPFSLIGLGPLAQQADGEATAAPPSSDAAAVALRVSAGSVRVGGKTIPLDGLTAALADLKSSGVDALILIPTATATVQDIVSVLEGIKAASIGSVTVLSRRSGP